MPSIVCPRPRIDESHLMRVASRLTERDRVIVRLLYEHRVLTSPQVRDIAFDSARRAEARLRVLYELRVVDRFRPQRWRGSAPYHWVLDAAGAAVIAAEREVDVATLTWRRDRSLALQASASLDHRVGTNGFFTALIREARAHQGRRLAAWWPEWRCAAEWGEIARPDGYGIWHEGGARVPFLLEYDRGTERGVRLSEKLRGYDELLAVAAHPTWLLFCFPTARREAEARRALTGGPALLATAVVPAGASPAEPVWLPIHLTRRVRLGELPAWQEAGSWA